MISPNATAYMPVTRHELRYRTKDMALPISFDYAPMNARLVDDVPEGGEWQYEPKWDGFRCIAFRDGSQIELRSKSGQTLGRYFPEIVAALANLKAKKFALDGEIVVPVGQGLSFDQLLQRIHPAESRIRKLSAEFPATFILFDVLVDPRGKSLTDVPLSDRRDMLEDFAKKYAGNSERLALSPATTDIKQARKWFAKVGGALDGIVAKRTDIPYQSDNRDGMVKIKRHRTADCVVGGFRYASKEKVIGSLLLGLFDDKGLLNHVGFCSAIKAAERKRLTPKLEELVSPPGFTGQAPGGPSRWSTDRSTKWEPLKPKLVVEVGYDHYTAGRFRHGTQLIRWRPDKAPKQCTMKQVEEEESATVFSFK
jgi:ATP-dependent DNA ligase